MGWEKRGNNYYYYQKEWINGKCVSTYTGTGYVADLISRLDDGNRFKKEREAQREAQKREEFEEIDRQLDELEQQTKELVEVFLIENGFYRTSSREWRLRKNGNSR